MRMVWMGRSHLDGTGNQEPRSKKQSLHVFFGEMTFFENLISVTEMDVFLE